MYLEDNIASDCRSRLLKARPFQERKQIYTYIEENSAQSGILDDDMDCLDNLRGLLPSLFII